MSVDTDLDSRFSAVAFEGYAGRSRMFAEWLEILQGRGVFDGEFLPPSALEFLSTYYSANVPYHGLCHIPPMLLTSYAMRDRIPVTARVAALGHDAGHNGDKATSPEALSADYTVAWLETESEWVERHEVDLDEVARVIRATEFPYSAPSRTDAERWMRWLDTVRASSGITAEHLAMEGVDAILLMLVESLPLRLEFGLEVSEMLVGQVDGFLAGVHSDLAAGELYPAEAKPESIEPLRDELQVRLRDPAERQYVSAIDEFLHGDVTLREAAAEWAALRGG